MRLFRRNREDQESVKALEEASKNLERAKERDPEVKEVAESLRCIREQNHFAERLEAIMKGLNYDA